MILGELRGTILQEAGMVLPQGPKLNSLPKKPVPKAVKPQQSAPPQQPGQEEEDQFEDPVEDAGDMNNDPPEFTALKKHYILNKLKELKAKLDAKNITCEELDAVIMFGVELSYDTLTILSDSIIEFIKQNLQGAKSNDKTKKNV